MRVAPGVDLIPLEFSERPMNLPLIRGEQSVLIDTGLAHTPGEVIIPYLRTQGLEPRDLSWVIVTHAHADHFGGNEALWLASGKSVRFAVHQLDQRWVEDPAGETRRANQRLVDLGLMSRHELEEGIGVSGGPVPVARTFQGGEVFALGNGVELEVFHTPGHTPGNLCLFERKSATLLQGETIVGIAQYNVRSELLTCPYWEDLALYLQTIATVARIPFRTLVPSHLPVMDRAQAIHFIRESLSFALRFDAELRQRLQAAQGPITALALTKSMDRLWGLYPADLGLYMLVEQQLLGLVRRGLVTGSQEAGFTWADRASLEESGLAPTIQEAQEAVQAMDSLLGEKGA